MDLNNSVGNKVFHAGDIFTGIPTKIKEFSNTIKVAYHGANGTLRIYQSPNGKLWSYYEEFPVSGNSFAQSGINGNYYYVQYTNITGTNTVTLATNLSQQIHDNFSVQLDSGDTVTVAGLLFNEDGALIVSSTGGGVSADVNVTNTSLDVNVLNPTDVSMLATAQLQQESNVAICSRLSTIAEASEINSEYLQGILTKATGLQHQSTKYTLSAVSSLAPDTIPAFTQPPSGSGVDGWYFKNTSLLQPSQIYYYSYVNPSQQVPARQKTYTIGDISGSYCVVNMLSVNATEGLVTLGIYSQPTGSGDAAPGFYKSRKVYTIPVGAELTQGMTVLLYWGLPPDNRLFPDVKRIEMTLSTSVGPALSTENLAFLTLNTDSQALIGNAEYIVSHAGWIYGAEHIHDTQFTAESDVVAAGDASASNQILQLTQAQESNIAICARLDKNVYTSSNLHVRDDLLKASMESQFTNLNSVIGQGLYINMDSDPIVSGGVKLRGFTDGNLFVHDSRATAQLVDCVSGISSLNGTLTSLIDGTEQMYVTLSGADDSVSIMGFNAVLDMPQTVTLTEDGTIRSLDVAVKNNIIVDSSTPLNTLLLAKSGENNAYLTVDANQNLNTHITNSSLAVTGDFFQASQPIEGTVSANVKSGDVPITFTDYGTIQALDVSIKNSSVAVTGTFWQESQPVTIAQMSFTAQDELITYDDYTFQELQTLNQHVTKCDTDNVTISGTVPISIADNVAVINGSGTALDVHAYGSSDGIAWHHIKTNTQGVVSTNAVLETDANGALTSTSVTGGTDNYNALHVLVKGTTAVSLANPVNIATTDNGTITSTLSGSGNSIHALDVSVKGSVTVENVASTQLAVKNTDSTAIFIKPRNSVWTQVASNLPSVFGPSAFGSTIDTDGYTYIWAYLTIGSVTTGGAIYVEFSPDGVTWIRSYYNQYVNPGSNQTINITIGNSVPLRYYRFYADSGVGLATVNAYFAMK